MEIFLNYNLSIYLSPCLITSYKNVRQMIKLNLLRLRLQPDIFFRIIDYRQTENVKETDHEFPILWILFSLTIIYHLEFSKIAKMSRIE